MLTYCLGKYHPKLQQINLIYFLKVKPYYLQVSLNSDEAQLVTVWELLDGRISSYEESAWYDTVIFLFLLQDSAAMFRFEG